MPQHSDKARWRALATTLGWAGDIPSLRKFVLIAASSYEEISPSAVLDFCGYYFPNMVNVEAIDSRSLYNNLKEVKRYLAGVLNLEMHTTEEYLSRYSEYSEWELIEWCVDKRYILALSHS